MAKLAKNKAAKDSGNVTIVDLGEDIDKHMNRRIDAKLKAAGVVGETKETMAGSPGYKAGGYRPGMFGYRPWYADKQSKYGHLMGNSDGFTYAQRMRGLARPDLGKMAIGGAIGLVADLALMRVTPDVVKSDLSMIHTGIAFLVGLVPVLARPNSYTLGVAVPGTLLLGASIVNFALDSIGIRKPALRGSDAGGSRSIDPALATRQKLAQVHQQMNRPAAAPTRVTAQAV